MKRLSTILLLAALCFSSCQTGQDSWVIGPFYRPSDQPVISPDATKEFLCPMRGEMVKWQESDTFNPAATTKDGKICVLFRSEDNSATGIGSRTSRIGYAETEDGLNMTIAPEPVLFPADDDFKALDWTGGCEDPRVAVTEDGLYVMMYTSWNHDTPRLSVATSRDLKTWQKHGFAFADAEGGRYAEMPCKSGSIVTRLDGDNLTIEKIGGKYLMYWGEDFVNPATSEDLIHWTPMLDENGELLEVIKPREGMFDSGLTECGPPAVHTKDGIVLIYNGKSDETGAYSAGQVLLDAKEPTKVLARLDEPFLKPELDFEKSGQYVDGTVFVEGLVRYKGKWFLYYGCADSFVGLAVSDQTL
ncbi:MAG: hypothetical protein KBS80_03480 [Bacteroidales bacterium]|nr:hypothetical protein [Candidatus Cryptobacteroides choladohippi]